MSEDNNKWKKADKALDVAGFTLHSILRIVQALFSGGFGLWLLWYQFIYEPVPDFLGRVPEGPPWWTFIAAIALFYNAYRSVSGQSFIGLG
ncbi:hypothetical protein JZO70_21505 [Enterococcus sp. 669A]|uniref:Uncharacterized protein n=1 Tax=Candidatus Enterococcus moelleringii TaxID=2815325 RepID=A0ABS3LI79_9ENTE|nr:hypothetical protein [Enterococcus sp. 669A]MBO1308763.1 hypothetical protein [Enterococcus sp. 669A]